MSHPIAFSRLTQLHANDKLQPTRNKGKSTTVEHEAAIGVKLVAVAMTEVALKSPGWIEYVETTSLVDSTAPYQHPEMYDAAFPQMRFGMRIPQEVPEGCVIPHFDTSFGWRSNYGLRAVVIEATECGDDDLRVSLHTLMSPGGKNLLLATTRLNGSIEAWQFIGRDSAKTLVDAVMGSADTEQRQAVMANAYPNTEVQLKSQFAEDLRRLGEMLSAFRLYPHPQAEAPAG